MAPGTAAPLQRRASIADHGETSARGHRGMLYQPKLTPIVPFGWREVRPRPWSYGSGSNRQRVAKLSSGQRILAAMLTQIRQA